MPTPIEARVTLAQWLSPAYPTGGFAWSHGLETEVAEGRVTDQASFAAWLADVLEHGLGRTDAVLLAEAHRAAPEALPALDAEARAFAPSAERRAETAEQGAAFARTTAAVWGLDLPPLTHPVALGHAAARAGLPLEEAAALYLHATAANLAGAAPGRMPWSPAPLRDRRRRATTPSPLKTPFPAKKTPFSTRTPCVTSWPRSSGRSFRVRWVSGSPICTACAGDSVRSSSDEKVAP